MSYNINKIIIRIIFFFFIICDIFSANAQEAIVNPSVRIDSYPINALRAIFSMRLREWPDGTPITVFILPNKNEIHSSFCKNKLHVLPHQLQRAWDRLVFSGMGQSPIEVSNEEEMLKKVATTPGAIGYLRSEYANKDVRIIQVK